MSGNIQFSPSTFIIDNDVTHFFKKSMQDDYKKKSSVAIEKGLKKVELCEKSHEMLSALFFELLADFGHARKDIAESHNIDDQNAFGERREPFSGHCTTCLDDVYKPFNTRVIKKFRLLLDPYGAQLESRTHEKIKVIENSIFQGHGSSFEVEIFDEDEVANLKNIEPFNFPEELSAENLEMRRKAFESFYNQNYDKATQIELYSHIKTLHKKYPYLQKSAYGRLVQNDENLKSFYALGTVRFTVDAKPTVVSQYLLWMHRDGITHPLSRMQRHTICTIIHQPSFLVEPTLKEVSLLFAKAILWDKEHLNKLKEYVGLFRAYFTHACCFCRGSASIGEYFETLLYGYHGFRLEYSNETLVDLEAFAAPLLSDFMANYMYAIRLKAISQ